MVRYSSQINTRLQSSTQYEKHCKYENFVANKIYELKQFQSRILEVQHLASKVLTIIKLNNK
ncbi:hypothetical protein Hanom_Chr05g00418711 [Helianthus anomalus]